MENTIENFLLQLQGYQRPIWRFSIKEPGTNGQKRENLKIQGQLLKGVGRNKKQEMSW